MGRQQGSFHWSSGHRAIEKDYDQKVLPVANHRKLFLVLDSFSINRKIGMSEDTSNFSIDPDGGVTPSTFTYSDRRVEIVSPDTAHLIGNYWQIKIDGVLRGNYVFSTAREAADEARKLIDRNEE
jgi:hypothetical protein